MFTPYMAAWISSKFYVTNIFFFLDFPIYLHYAEIHSANGVMEGEGE
jgi:hypothetical protein